MKLNIDWLMDFVAVEGDADALAERLTLAGLEVDGVEPVAPDLDGVVVAEIVGLRPHPNADRLNICEVADGQARHEIVCGAPNARAGLRVPFAPVGTVLPGGSTIRAAKIRGVRSEGMLCSARELGLSEDASGLLVLDETATLGKPLVEHLGLDDHALDIDLTPNRGDCFSVVGIAREIAARQGAGPLDESLDCIEPVTDATFPVELIDSEACPRFAGRVIGELQATARSPDWLRERLRRAGLRAIHPVVDVTNYVMLETGQPLHAYRLDRLQGAISVRFAHEDERLVLLDETELTLDTDNLVIADETGAIGLAGIMGGLSTAVDAETTEIFLESAFFSQAAIQGRARRHGMHTDASVRFERGVDPTGQERAIERATALLRDIAGGRPGPVVLAEDEAATPVRKPVALREARVRRLLGVEIPGAEIARLLELLGMQVEPADDGWSVTPPSYRFDIAIEEDLIEEVGRMVGYDEIPVDPGASAVRLGTDPERTVSADALSDILVARGFSEIVSYGFTEARAQAGITGSTDAIDLANPISRDLGVLRESLWPGLLEAARLNQSRQQERCRLFETGTVFAKDRDRVSESTRIAGLITGSRQPAHWDGAVVASDFFDLKGDVEALLSVWHTDEDTAFRAESNAALKPSSAAAIYRAGRQVGWLGELHPALQKAYDFRQTVVLFDLDLTAMGEARLPKYAGYSKFPSVRRDLAVVVDERVTAAELTERVRAELGEALKRQEIFDVYRGKGVESGRKSIAIGLILQDAYRTLTDEETDAMIQRLMHRLELELEATIRS
jgi:phenylalanyl-tRNA synthetase beta chain